MIVGDAFSHHIIHVGYIVHNAELEDTFYRKLLGFRPYWHGGRTDDSNEWISEQLPDGRDWIEYMTTAAPGIGIPADMSQATVGVLDHFSLGVGNIETIFTTLYNEHRLENQKDTPKIGRDAKWQLNLYDPDGVRAEVMELQPIGKPCCSPFLQPSPTK